MRLAPDRPEKPDSEAVRAIADSGCNGHFRDRQVSDRIQFGGGAGDDGAGLPLLERIAAPTDGTDPERSLLPLLLQRLNAEQRRLLWHRYLRELPLNPRQIQKVIGLEPEEQQRLEEKALELLRQAAREHGAL
jgi:hypothetical protein